MKTISALAAILMVASLSLSAHAECSSQNSGDINASTNPAATNSSAPPPADSTSKATPELGS